MLILFPLLIKLKSADHRIDPSYQQKIAGYFPIVNQSKDCVNNRIYAKNNRAYFALLQVYPQAHPQHDNNIDQKIWTLQYKNTQNNGKGCTDITDDCITVQLFLKSAVFGKLQKLFLCRNSRWAGPPAQWGSTIRTERCTIFTKLATLCTLFHCLT